MLSPENLLSSCWPRTSMAVYRPETSCFSGNLGDSNSRPSLLKFNVQPFCENHCIDSRRSSWSSWHTYNFFRVASLHRQPPSFHYLIIQGWVDLLVLPSEALPRRLWEDLEGICGHHHHRLELDFKVWNDSTFREPLKLKLMTFRTLSSLSP